MLSLPASMNFVVLKLNGHLKGREDFLNTAGNFRANAVSWEEHHSMLKSGKVA